MRYDTNVKIDCYYLDKRKDLKLERWMTITLIKTLKTVFNFEQASNVLRPDSTLIDFWAKRHFNQIKTFKQTIQTIDIY
jgi:hypothetical protein